MQLDGVQNLPIRAALHIRVALHIVSIFYILLVLLTSGFRPRRDAIWMLYGGSGQNLSIRVVLV